MFLSALFVRAITWKQHRYSCIKEWMKKMWLICNMKYYSMVKEWHIEIFMQSDRTSKNNSEWGNLDPERWPWYVLNHKWIQCKFSWICCPYSNHHELKIFHGHSRPFELRSIKHIEKENTNSTSSFSEKPAQPLPCRTGRGAQSGISMSVHSMINTEHRLFTMELRMTWVFLVVLFYMEVYDKKEMMSL